MSFFSIVRSFGVLAQIGSGMVRDGPGVRLHQGSTGFHKDLRGLRGGANTICC